MTQPAAPVLVTGLPRTGTTWLGNTLCLSGELGELYEPFNPGSHRARWFDPPHFYLYIDETLEERYLRPVSQLVQLRYPLTSRLAAARSPRDVRAALDTAWRVARLRRERRVPLVKDPIALFSTPWLHERFGFRPVLLLRHPCGFVSSVLRMGWRISFQSWLRQERLMATLLVPWRDEIEAAASRSPDEVLDASLFWKVCSGVIGELAAGHPDWIVVRHEDLAADPVVAFESMYARLGLQWSTATARAVEEATGAENPREAATGVQHELRRDSRAVAELWRTRLSAAQVATVRAVTSPVADAHYGPETWVDGSVSPPTD